MDPFSEYQAMPHDQVNWAALAQQWMAMKEPQFGNNSNWDAASRGKPIFPSATNIRFDANGRPPPPPPPSNDYGRPPPPPNNYPPRPGPPNGDWSASRNEDWRVPPHGWNQGPPMPMTMPPRMPPGPPPRSFFPPPPRPMNGAPPPPLMGFHPPPPPFEDDWGFGWTPPPPRLPLKTGPPPPLFPSATNAVAPPMPVPLFPPPQMYNNNYTPVEQNVPSPEVPFFSGVDSHLDDNARNKLPAWIREGLEKAEMEKKKQAEKEERIRLAEEEKKKRRELAGKSKFDSDSSDEEGEKRDKYNSAKHGKVEPQEEPEPTITADDLREQAMLYIRQFMTKVLTDGTDQLLRATCSEAMREAEKAEAEPKLLAKSSALAALSSLGDDDDETDSDTDEKPSTTNASDKSRDDFIFKAPIGIPRNFNKPSEERGAAKTEPQLPKAQPNDETENSKSVEHKAANNGEKDPRKSDSRRDAVEVEVPKRGENVVGVHRKRGSTVTGNVAALVKEKDLVAVNDVGRVVENAEDHGKESATAALAAAKRKNHNKVTVADDVATPPVKATGKQSSKKVEVHVDPTEEQSIDDVDEDKIDEILRDASKNLVIFFYGGRAQCPSCSEALSEVEEIDDDIEATGYVQVVKTDDRAVARELGVNTFPAMVYYRRKNPIMYDGDFKDSQAVLRWLRSHEEVVTWELTDNDFERKTDSHSPDEGNLDWFVMFYDADEGACNAFVPMWENVAHKLRGLVHVGKVETSVNDDVTERFDIDHADCPAFLLFHRGKVYRYKEAAKDVRSLVNFALFKFKEQRGHRVPEPPTAIEHVYEFVKEKVIEMTEDKQAMSVLAVGGLILIVSVTLILKAYRINKEKNKTA